MKKKILLITQNFWPENFPINDIAFELSKKNSLLVLTGKPNYPKGNIYKGYSKFSYEIENKSKNLKIIRVPIIPRFNANKFNLILNYLSYVFSAIFFGLFLIYKKKINKILVYCPSPITQIIVGIFFNKIKKAKLYTWVQDIWPESIYATGNLKKNFFNKILKSICNSIYNCSDVLFLQSQSFFNYFNFTKKKVNKIYLPNHGKQFKKKKISKINPFKNNYFNILYTGNIGKAQNFDKLIKVAKVLNKKNSRVCLHLIGDGSYKNKLIKDKEKYKLKNIVFYKYMKSKNLNTYIYYSDILLVSLKNDPILNITVPSKFQNYLASKKPILGFIGGETARLIKNSKSGYVCPPNNVKMFIDLILKISKYKNSFILRKKSINGYNFFKKNYDLKVITKKMINHL